eukprot:4158005-Amphidinium_carterae.1
MSQPLQSRRDGSSMSDLCMFMVLSLPAKTTLPTVFMKMHLSVTFHGRPTPVVEQDVPLELPVETLPKAPHEVGPHKRVLEYDEFARCL